ncbi:hypothetical protein IQ07DRAFT_667197 [Pyrenochaeta sp. DS3sAY3a]|nr:hypothetical protein IQ07DRAFT_667197 [Pyrenochaeta sp. DS3sAY3a]
MAFSATPLSRLFLLSANGECGLAYMRIIPCRPPPNTIRLREGLLDSLACTLCESRSRFSYSATIVAQDILDLEGRLQSPVPVSSSRATPPRTGFIFTGQGAQWWVMVWALSGICWKSPQE